MVVESGSRQLLYVAAAVVLGVLILSIRVNPAQGRFPTTGIPAAQLATLKKGDPILVRRQSDRSLFPARIDFVGADGIHYGTTARFRPGTAPPSEILRVADLPSGTWIESPVDGCRRFAVLDRVTADGLDAECGGRHVVIPFEKSGVPDPEDLNGPLRTVSFVWFVLAMATAVLVGTNRRLDASEAQRSAAERALNEARASLAEAEQALSSSGTAFHKCPGCQAPVPLIAAPRTLCKHCGQEVAISEEYLRLARARDARAGETKLAVAAVESALRVTHPVMSILYAGVAFGIGAALLRLKGLSAHAALGSSMSALEGLWVIALLVPAGLLVATASQVAQHWRLAEVCLDFAPTADNGGFACRNCGGPLAGQEPGTGEPCAYCGVENLVPRQVVRATGKANKEARALARTVDFARATASDALWRTVGMPLVAFTRVLVPATALVGIIVLALALIAR